MYVKYRINELKTVISVSQLIGKEHYTTTEKAMLKELMYLQERIEKILNNQGGI